MQVVSAVPVGNISWGSLIHVKDEQRSVSQGTGLWQWFQELAEAKTKEQIQAMVYCSKLPECSLPSDQDLVGATCSL